MDCGPPGSYLSGVLQARILEWVAIPFSRGAQGLNQVLLHCRQILYHLSQQGSAHPKASQIPEIVKGRPTGMPAIFKPTILKQVPQPPPLSVFTGLCPSALIIPGLDSRQLDRPYVPESTEFTQITTAWLAGFSL